jgi:hypothetical protein
MIRKLVVVMAVGTAVLSVAPAAWAKCDPSTDPEHGGCIEVTEAGATISGPGLSGPLTIGGPPVFDMLRQAGFSSRSHSWSPDEWFPGEDRLGPRYDLTVEILTATGDRYRFTADLYPYAENTAVPGAPSAWVYFAEAETAPVTERVDGRLFTFDEIDGPAGWWRSSALYYTLAGEGLPHDPPIAPADGGLAVAPVPATDPGISTGARAGLVVLSLAVVVALAALTGRRRRGATA